MQYNVCIIVAAIAVLWAISSAATGPAPVWSWAAVVSAPFQLVFLLSASWRVGEPAVLSVTAVPDLNRQSLIVPFGDRTRLPNDLLLAHQQREPAQDQRHVDQAAERQLAQPGLDALADENASERHRKRDRHARVTPGAAS